ncbi:heavy-metal-associated domain-containing protein [Stenotrophomonas sp. CFBP 13724]|uniref:heavy-metal-associated domain-containing protein n=2 Tax=unclassified Stenotrophomonas TaxID=196198 RepID=UPI0020172BFC|nr:heavy-metal-associated domain-containing protein [Stenotrophomonas sp. CFBP 13724]
MHAKDDAISSKKQVDLATLATRKVVGVPTHQEMTMLQFHIPQMTCGSCAKPVRAALLGADPSAGIQIDMAARTVSVDTVLEPAVFLAALAEAGYPPLSRPAG